ncbi:MAG: hypothetical protein LCH84_10700 [Gemmatimonadetes bacterium]|nr:hypothetical protein [Gemmatimonadota bacterium]
MTCTARHAALLFGALLLLAPRAARAQATPPPARRDSAARADSIARADSVARSAPRAAARPGALQRLRVPPLTPKRAFLYSALLPGFGQSRLDRGSSGALFASTELASIVMLRRSMTDLREARRFRTDTLPENFVVGPGGETTPSGTVVGRYTSDLVRTRRLHVEDWLAVIAFNHLFAGADAFVSAQLFSIPVDLAAVPTRGGIMVLATRRF